MSCNSSGLQQQWSLQASQPTGKFTLIKNTATGMCLDVNGGGANTIVSLVPCAPESSLEVLNQAVMFRFSSLTDPASGATCYDSATTCQAANSNACYGTTASNSCVLSSGAGGSCGKVSNNAYSYYCPLGETPRWAPPPPGRANAYPQYALPSPPAPPATPWPLLNMNAKVAAGIAVGIVLGVLVAVIIAVLRQSQLRARRHRALLGKDDDSSDSGVMPARLQLGAEPDWADDSTKKGLLTSFVRSFNSAAPRTSSTPKAQPQKVLVPFELAFWTHWMNPPTRTYLTHIEAMPPVNSGADDQPSHGVWTMPMGTSGAELEDGDGPLGIAGESR
jgi:hypothetical protein